MLFDTTDFNYEVSLFKLANKESNKDICIDKFLTPEEGFLRGNMEKGTYCPYKQFTYCQLKPSNERERLLFKLMAYSFAINELNLYLDLNPEDQTTYELFKRYVKDKECIEKEFVMRYGPMTLEDIESSQYEWLNNPWPWDNSGGREYV